MKFRQVTAFICTSVVASVSLAASAAPPAPAPVTAKTGYFPVIIYNDTTLTPDPTLTDVYFLALGQNVSTSVPCAFSFKSEMVGNNQAEVGTCVPISKSMNTQDYAVSLTKLPAYNKKTNSVLVYFSQVISGRAYVSLSHKLTIPVIKPTVPKGQKAPPGTYTFQTPNMNNTYDPNYNILWDKFEYTYDNKFVFWVNPTSVDFFAIPISLIPFNQQNPSGAPVGAGRSSLISAMTKDIQDHDTSPAGSWSSHSVIMDLSGKTNTVLRIAAPYVAPKFPLTTYLNQPNSATSYNYIDALIAYYKTHTISVDCSELAGDKAAAIHTFYGGSTDKQLYQFTGSIQTINDKPTFVFTNNPPAGKKAYHKIEIDMSNPALLSQGFFMPGQAPFTTVNDTVQSVIIKNLTAAFSVGLLPAPDKTELTSAYFAANKANFYRANNPQLQNRFGPWFDLYSKAIHASIPITYAYAYDDVLGQDGTLNSNVNTNPITIVLGDMSGVAIPAPFTPGPPPPPPHIQPVQNVTTSGFVCSGGNCTLTANWDLPVSQLSGVSYYVFPQSFQLTTPVDIVKANIANGNYFVSGTATSGKISLPQANVLQMGSKVSVYTCIQSQGNANACPSSHNGYTLTKSIGASSK